MSTSPFHPAKLCCMSGVLLLHSTHSCSNAYTARAGHTTISNNIKKTNACGCFPHSLPPNHKDMHVTKPAQNGSPRIQDTHHEKNNGVIEPHNHWARNCSPPVSPPELPPNRSKARATKPQLRCPCWYPNLDHLQPSLAFKFTNSKPSVTIHTR